MPNPFPEAWPAQRVGNNCQRCAQRKTCYLSVPDGCDNSGCDIVQKRFTLRAGDRLFRLGGHCTALFQVCSGAIKTQRDTADGDLVVSGFYLPGDLVGIEALSDRVFPCEAVACGETEICQLDFGRLLSSCASRPGLNAWIISTISSHVRRKDSDLSWSGGQPSRQRVLRFFLDLHERLDATIENDAVRPLRLPMRKQDVARYLHLTPETFSRNLAQLKRDGLLLIHKSEFVLPDIERARAASGS